MSSPDGLNDLLEEMLDAHGEVASTAPGTAHNRKWTASRDASRSAIIGLVAKLERERDEALAFLRRTAITGGSIVSSAAMTPTQIAVAMAADRMLVMSDGCGFVYVPEGNRPPAEDLDAPPVPTAYGIAAIAERAEALAALEAERSNAQASIDETLQVSAERNEALANLEEVKCAHAEAIATLMTSNAAMIDLLASRSALREAQEKLASIAMERDEARRELDLFKMENAGHWRDVGDTIKVAIENATSPLEERVRHLEERERTLLPKAERCDRYEAPGPVLLTQEQIDAVANSDWEGSHLSLVHALLAAQHARDVAIVEAMNDESIAIAILTTINIESAGEAVRAAILRALKGEP